MFDQATGEVDTLKVSGRPEVALAWLQGLERPFVAVYEAGPTGYGLARAAAARGFDVRVCSPGGTPKRPNDRIKTDTRDALRLARLLAAGELRPVQIPKPDEEHLRDLVRAREAVRVDLARARHRIGKLLLRGGMYYRKGGRAWSGEHLAWLRSLSFDDRPSELVFDDLLHGHDVLLERCERLDEALAIAAAESSWADTIARLRCLRGVETLTAVGLCAEIGDLQRFEHPRYLGSYLGLLPSENSSGDRRRQGSITKIGSTHARRLLIEASRHYRTKLGGRSAVHRRQRGADPACCRGRPTGQPPPSWALGPPRARAQEALHRRRGRRRTRVDHVLLGARGHDLIASVSFVGPALACWHARGVLSIGHGPTERHFHRPGRVCRYGTGSGHSR